jgi:hypothetical protein
VGIRHLSRNKPQLTPTEQRSIGETKGQNGVDALPSSAATSEEVLTDSWDKLEKYARPEELACQFPNLGREWTRQIAERRTRDLRSLREAEQLGVDTTANRAFLLTLLEKENRDFAEWDEKALWLDEYNRSENPTPIPRLEAIATLARALHEAKPFLDPGDLREQVRKRIERAIKKGQLPRIRLNRPCPRGEPLQDDDLLPLPELVKWVRKTYPRLPPPWRHRRTISRTHTVRWGSRVDNGLPDFSKGLIALAKENDLLDELRRMMDYIQALEADKADCTCALDAERKRFSQLQTELDEAKRKLDRHGSGRPKNRV